MPSRPILAALALLLATLPALAAEEPLRIELNRLEPREGGACRVWLVLNNGGAQPLVGALQGCLDLGEGGSRGSGHVRTVRRARLRPVGVLPRAIRAEKR